MQERDDPVLVTEHRYKESTEAFRRSQRIQYPHVDLSVEETCFQEKEKSSRRKVDGERVRRDEAEKERRGADPQLLLLLF